MKVYVKEKADGPELVFPTYAEFQTLWQKKFISDDDLVRREGSSRWIRAADLPELRAVKHRTRGEFRGTVWISIILIAVTLAAVLWYF